MDKPGPKRILVVDDEECIAETLTMILCNFGYDATARFSAQAALEQCEFQAPDLVISDVMMPGVNGIELAVEIERRYPGSRILLISGLGSSFALLGESSQKGHSFEIMSKPIRPLDLRARIAAVLADDRPLRTAEAPGTTGIFQAPTSEGI